MPPARPNRYELPFTSMVGAIIVVLVAIGAFVGIRALVRTNDAVPVRTVEYVHLLRAGKADGLLSMQSPVPMPSGWRATSARYTGGGTAAWHLGILTSDEEYVGIDEALDSRDRMLEDHVSGEVTRGERVRIGDHEWQQWRGAKGDRILTRQEGKATLLVRGTVPASVLRGFVERLKPA